MTENTTDLEAEARAEAERRLTPAKGTVQRIMNPSLMLAFEAGYVAGVRRPFTDAEVEAMAKRILGNRWSEHGDGPKDWARERARGYLDAITKMRGEGND